MIEGLFGGIFEGDPVEPPTLNKVVPPMKKRDFTVDELKRFNGIDEEHICFALLGKVYDVTKGKDFYGVDGAYGPLAGHDATRALGSMNIKLIKDEYDDISDMPESDLDDAREWAERLAFKYPVVGNLLAPGQEHAVYDDETTST